MKNRISNKVPTNHKASGSRTVKPGGIQIKIPKDCRPALDDAVQQTGLSAVELVTRCLTHFVESRLGARESVKILTGRRTTGDNQTLSWVKGQLVITNKAGKQNVSQHDSLLWLADEWEHEDSDGFDFETSVFPRFLRTVVGLPLPKKT
jgi:hypothetical protein